MYTISVRTSFSAAHHLRGYEGACERAHGHNWLVEVFVEGEELNETGMVLDFRKLRASLSSVIEKLDHSDLNDLEIFKTVNPTSENIAKYIFDSMTKEINDPKLYVSKVTVGETDSTTASYSP